MELREKIAGKMSANIHRDISLKIADAILELPEIKEALAKTGIPDGERGTFGGEPYRYVKAEGVWIHE